MDDDIRSIFQSLTKFKETLKSTFRDPDKERTAERQIRTLRQRGSASEYAAQFRQILSRLGWDDEPLMAQFYKGLKDKVKDKLIKENRPNEFSEYVAMAV